MKTAVIVSGEYRTFSICRPTMTFLDHNLTDIYFSTWPLTIYNIKRLNFKKIEKVTNEIIIKDLKKQSVISLGNFNTCVKDIDPNIKMIDRWINGLRLIKESGIKYDKIIITRPDLYFSKNIFDVSQVPNNFNVWYNSNSRLDDNFILGDSDIIQTVINEELLVELSNYVSNSNKWKNWHNWWYNWVRLKIGNNLNFFNIGDRGIMCRPIIKDKINYENLIKVDHDFTLLKFLEIEDKFGKNFAMQIDSNIYYKAKNLWDAGYFQKYINYAQVAERPNASDCKPEKP